MNAPTGVSGDYVVIVNEYTTTSGVIAGKRGEAHSAFHIPHFQRLVIRSGKRPSPVST